MPKEIIVLGLASLFMDISSEMIHALLPVFMVTLLGSNATIVGIIEGLGEGLALIVRVFSGALSDWLARRKHLILIGYLLGTFSKPLFAIATASGMVMFARALNRIGKGIRSAPLDALVADSVGESVRGTAFGIYGLATGCVIIIASIFAGWLWDQYGTPMTFYAGVGFSLLTLFALPLVTRALPEKSGLDL